ncbi:MAG: hypothetical protein K8H84_12090 [Sulfuricella denitrificans]|nr:hypothetical protein [Sulfuricella denitrificans]
MSIDKQIIFEKTPKGIIESKGRWSLFASTAQKILALIDGVSTTEQVLATSGMKEKKFLDEMEVLLRDRLIRETYAPNTQFTINAGPHVPQGIHVTVENTQAFMDAVAKQKPGEKEDVDEGLMSFDDVEEKLRREAEQLVRREEAERQFQVEEKVKQEATRKALAEEERKTREASERQAREEASQRARDEAEHKAREEKEQKARAEAERKASEEVRRAQEETDRREKEEAKRRAREEAERQAKEARVARRLQAREKEQQRILAEEERKARKEAELRAKAEAERLAREEAERVAREEAEHKAKEEAERLAREEAERIAREEAELRAKAEAERQAREEAERIAREEAELRAKAEAERQAREEAERIAREEAELRAKAEAERQAREEAERIAHEEAEHKAKEEAERLAREEVERIKHEEAELESVEQSAHIPHVEDVHQEAEPGARMAGILRMLKWGAAGVVLLLLIGLAGIHFVPLSSTQKRLETLVSVRLGEPVKMQSLHIALFPSPSLKLKQVEIGSHGGIRIEDARIYAGWGTLLGEGRRVERIELEKIDLATGVLESIAAWPAKSVQQQPAYEIGQITLRQAKIAASDGVLPPFRGEFGFSKPGRIEKGWLESENGALRADFSSTAEGLAVTVNVRDFVPSIFLPVRVDSLQATGTVSGRQIRFAELKGSSHGGKVSGSLLLSWDQGWSAKGDVRIVGVNLAPASSDKLVVSGKLDAALAFEQQAKLPENLFKSPVLSGSVTLQGGKVTGFDLPAAIHYGVEAIYSAYTDFDTWSFKLEPLGDKQAYKSLRIVGPDLQLDGNSVVSGKGAISGAVKLQVEAKKKTVRGNYILGGTLERPTIRPAGLSK